MRVKIKNIKRLNISSKKYDISVEGNSNFFANNILVHNSYIGVFWYNGEMVVNSKGSFTSPYAIEAKRILEEKYSKTLRYIKNFCYNFGEPTSFIFELIGFEQIVVSYPEPDLVLTGIFKGTDLICGVNDFKELSLDSFIKEFGYGLKSAKRFDGLDWKNIKNLNWQNSEGFVVRFSNESRCKIKFEDYLKLHRQMTNLSTTGIWEALSNEEPVSSILNDVPDEFYQKVHQYESKLKEEYSDLKQCIEIRFNFEIRDLKRSGIEMDLKEFRKKLSENISSYPLKSCIFALQDGKDISKAIWQLIKPKFEKI